MIIHHPAHTHTHTCTHLSPPCQPPMVGGIYSIRLAGPATSVAPSPRWTASRPTRHWVWVWLWTGTATSRARAAGWCRSCPSAGRGGGRARVFSPSREKARWGAAGVGDVGNGKHRILHHPSAACGTAAGSRTRRAPVTCTPHNRSEPNAPPPSSHPHTPPLTLTPPRLSPRLSLSPRPRVARRRWCSWSRT